MSKSRAPSFSNAESAACSRKMSPRRLERERVRESHAPRDLADDPPVGPRLAGRGQERALARDAALGIGDRAVLLAPGRARAAGHGRSAVVSVSRDHVGDDDERAGGQRRAHAVGVRHADDRIGAMIQSALIRPSRDGAEHVDGLQARLVGDDGARPEALHDARGARRSRSPCARRACWRGRRPRARPWRWAGR